MRRTGREADYIRAEIEDCISEMEAEREKEELVRRTATLIALLSKMQEANQRRPKKKKVT